jgi:MoaA/NifB/PqqE/SkfB family radical SAM enzyme
MPLANKVAQVMKKNHYTNSILEVIKPWYLKFQGLPQILSHYSLLHLYKFSIFHRFLYPERLYIFLTTRCNLRCFICRREDYIGSDIDFENLKILKNAIKYSKIVNLTGWGEATIYPKFPQVLEYIYSINPNNNLIELTTNGTRLSEAIAILLNGHLSFLQISLNAATDETYNRDMKNGDFLKTLTNIKKFLNALEDEAKEKIDLHFVAHTENFREIPKFVELAHELGIPSVSIGQYLVGCEEHRQFSLINVKDDYNNIISRAEARGKELDVRVVAPKFSNDLYLEKSILEFTAPPCLSPFNECFIQPDGDVGVCCYAGAESMGNAFKVSFESIWFGEKYHRLRQNRFFKACRRCIPNVSFDDPRAHITEHFKTESDLK